MQLRILIWDLLVALALLGFVLFWDIAGGWALGWQVLYGFGMSLCIVYFLRRAFPKGIRIILKEKKK